MTEQQAVQPMSGDAAVVREAYAAARELLRRAEEHAEQVRGDADRYARRREQEVELLVAKARRLLEVAEGRAAAIESGVVPPGAGGPPPRHLRQDDAHVTQPADIDLTAADLRSADAEAAALDPAPARTMRIQSDLDRLLAQAIAHAVDRSFTTGP